MQEFCFDVFINNYSMCFHSDQINNSEHYLNQTPSYKIIILGLAPSVTETDVSAISQNLSILFC